jgi:hypothetical protein
MFILETSKQLGRNPAFSNLEAEKNLATIVYTWLREVMEFFSKMWILFLFFPASRKLLFH